MASLAYAPARTAAAPSSGRRIAARVLFAAALLALFTALVIGISWAQDRARLRAVAEAATAGARTEQERITRLVDWVYHNQGFGKNQSYFLWRKLDATPIQVLERGGDCEDKSKLTATLARELGMPVTLSMVSACPECPAGHTVAVIKTASGWTPVDSVYNITFPEPQGRFTPIERLRADPALQARRVAELRAARGPEDKINHFPLDRDPFTYATTVNWEKNSLTRAAAAAITAAGGEPWRTPRPLFMDDPKQFFLVFFLCAALGLAAFGLLVRPRARVAALQNRA